MDIAKALEEAKWLATHPEFHQRPASIEEFLGVGYLEIESKVRPGLKAALKEIFGDEVNGDRIAHYEEAMITGGIGIGKTTFASIALPYMVHWVLCLKDPQGYFDLLPGSRIAFMQMSTSEDQALQVIFGDIKARVQHSPWFVQNYPMDDKFKNQIRFPKDIWILPGDSAETTFEGYNILAGILDEMDSHKVTREKDYADDGFNTIQSRIASRYIDPKTKGHRGLIICIGQMKKGDGFAARKYEEMKSNPRAYVMRMSIWESLGWSNFLDENGERDSFFYDTKRKAVIPKLAAGMVKNDDMIEVPNAYAAQFANKPEKALRDLAGIPPKTNDPFISLTDRIDDCVARWIDKFGDESPVLPDMTPIPKFAKWFKAENDPRRRAVHIDLATSSNGDAAGIAMGHIEGFDEIDGETKAHVVIDCLIRLKARPGNEIMIADVRRIIYYLKEELGFRIHHVTIDGFQSTDTIQILKKKKYRAEYLSVDRNTLPYEDLREAIYDGRIDFPPYVTYVNHGDTTKYQIAIRELQQLSDTGKKIDHPANGSKDLADAMAGVVNTLMGDRSYRKGISSRTGRSDISNDEELEATGTAGQENVIKFPGAGVSYMPPAAGGSLGLTIPNRLWPRDRR